VDHRATPSMVDQPLLAAIELAGDGVHDWFRGSNLTTGVSKGRGHRGEPHLEQQMATQRRLLAGGRERRWWPEVFHREQLSTEGKQRERRCGKAKLSNECASMAVVLENEAGAARERN
jgi:hypothetical protein